MMILLSMMASLFFWVPLGGQVFTLLFSLIVYMLTLIYGCGPMLSLDSVVSLDISISGVCFIMLLLTSFVMVVTLSSTKSPSSTFLWLHWFMFAALVFIFLFKNSVLYFALCEISLIPISLIILGWGYQPERSLAFMYMFMYTFCSALPLLLVLLMIGVTEASWNVFQFNFVSAAQPTTMSSVFKLMLVFSTVAAFLVKFPMYSVHLWLPKAHVEAPLTGSMILAGLLLKLGGFGWFLLQPLIINSDFFSFFLSSFSGAGAVVVSFICLRQIDMKVLIAYSSVAHLGVVIMSFSSGSVLPFIGGLFIMVAHGFSSPGMFYGANCLYNRSGSRNILMNSGMIQFMPSMTFFWFLLCMANMGAPPSSNLFSEALAISGLVNSDLGLSFQVSFLAFLSGAYTLVLYSSSQQGQKKPKFSYCLQTSALEFHVWFLLVFSVYGFSLMLILI